MGENHVRKKIILHGNKIVPGYEGFVVTNWLPKIAI